MGELV